MKIKIKSKGEFIKTSCSIYVSLLSHYHTKISSIITYNYLSVKGTNCFQTFSSKQIGLIYCSFAMKYTLIIMDLKFYARGNCC